MNRKTVPPFELHSKRIRFVDVLSYCHDFKFHKTHSGQIMEVSSSFDTETTSFYQHIETGDIISVSDANKLSKKTLEKSYRKGALVYAWVFTLHGNAFCGRTVEEFVTLCETLSKRYELDASRRLVCFVHNLAFDWQHIKKYFEWVSVFATKPRTPIKAVCSLGIEFRDSLILSGYSLAKTGENLHKYKIEKLVGDLDYKLLRHPKTKLSIKEWGYIINDGLVVSAYIQELIEEKGTLTRVPLTKTGFVRKFLKDRCMFEKSTHRRDTNKKFHKYRALMNRLQIGSLEEYLLLHQCYTGAIVHANAFRCNRIIEDVYSMDFTSSYPAQMVLSASFPMGRGRKVHPKDKKQFEEYLRLYACLIDARFYGIRKANNYESIISVSKCVEKEDVEEDNGRLLSGSCVRLIFNEIDMEIYRKFYKWKKISIIRLYVYPKGRLPSDFVRAVLELYKNKTVLKGVEGKEREYQRSKEDCNSAYGASVTDVCRKENVYDDKTGLWTVEDRDFWDQISHYNKSKSRFLFYPWGVWVTSLARRALASGIYNLKDDYIYSDTDSVKFVDFEAHKDYFEKYNRYIDRQIEKASQYHGIPVEMFKPKTKDGVEKTIGYWDFDGHYKRFKTLGAKRYAVEYEKDGKIVHSLTIAGVNKKTAIPYVESHEKDFFDCMEFGYVFTKEACGKNLHTYIDEERRGTMVDYQGNACDFVSPSCVHLEETTYEMTTSDDYKRLLDGIIELFLGY